MNEHANADENYIKVCINTGVKSLLNMDMAAVMKEKRKPTHYIVLIFNYTEDLKYKILQLLGVLNVIEEKSTFSENFQC